ncbi:MAG: phosphatase PAP2 family protein [Chloracidobacterium sp.]|nr:phosphatase PAP2 family protein [Chloracidobacterium sp.]
MREMTTGVASEADWRPAIALLTISALSVVIGAHPQPFGWEIAVTHWVQQWRWLHAPLLVVSWPGNSVVVQGLILMLICGLLARGGWRREARALAVVSVGAFLLNALLKAVVARPRPTPELAQLYIATDGWSFPSGHVMFYTAFYGGLAGFAKAKLPRGVKRTALYWLCVLMAGLVGPSRVFLGAHWLTDVLAGYGYGLAWLRLTGAALWQPATDEVGDRGVAAGTVGQHNQSTEGNTDV